MSDYKPRILNKYSHHTTSNTSISTFGSQSGSRKQSLTPIDISSAFINLRRRSLGYDNLNDHPKNEDEIPKVEGYHHPKNVTKADSSSDFLPSFKDHPAVEIKVHSANPNSSPLKFNALNNISNTIRRFSWNRPKTEVGPLPPPLQLRQMHKEHNSEDKENHVELQVINEVQSGAAIKQSTPSNSIVNANGNPRQEMASNDKTSSIRTGQAQGSQSGSLQAGNWEPPIIKNASGPSIQINSTNQRSDTSNGRIGLSHDRTERNSNQTSSYRNRHNFQDESDDVDTSDIQGWRVLRKEYFWDRCPPDEKCPWFLHDKPMALLVVVLAFNWVLNFIFASIFIELEGPAQKLRFQERDELRETIKQLRNNLTDSLDRIAAQSSISGNVAPNVEPKMDTKIIFEDYAKKLFENANITDEIEWNELTASEFVTSIQTTIGYGNIVPVTFEGKVVTLIFAIIGIPINYWYIFKLGSLFAATVMTLVRSCHKKMKELRVQTYNTGSVRERVGNMVAGFAQPVQQSIVSRLNEALRKDTRFHPGIIGVILVITLLGIAAIVSYMEGYRYFDSFYACFITFSLVGFGDINIYQYTYRSNWLNSLIYGSMLQTFGLVVVSAWVSSILQVFFVRSKH